MARIMGLNKVTASLRSLSLGGRKDATVRVGYAAPYAIYVHEDLEARHPNGGQAKYLEAPARALRAEMRKVVRDALLNKRSLAEALERAGRLLLDASRPLVPVDTGFLRDSGFVEVASR